MEKEKLSDLVDKQETLYTFGSFTIKDGIGRNKLWLENLQPLCRSCNAKKNNKIIQKYE